MASTWRLTCNKCGTEWDEPLDGKSPRVPVHCPAPGCRANKKIPVEAFGGTASVRPSRGQAAAPRGAVAVRRSAPTARGGTARRIAEPEPWRPSGADLERFVQGFAVLRRKDHPEVLEPSAIVPPSRPPPVRESSTDLAGKEPVAARLLGRLRAGKRRAPRDLHRSPVERLQGTTWCELCRMDGTASGGVFGVELAVDPFAADMCAGHLWRLLVESPRAVEVVRGPGLGGPVKPALAWCKGCLVDGRGRRAGGRRRRCW